MDKTIKDLIPKGFRLHSTESKIDPNNEEGCIKLYITKAPPRRRVFECVSEIPREPKQGEWFETNYGTLCPYIEGLTPQGEFKIFREVTED